MSTPKAADSQTHGKGAATKPSAGIPVAALKRFANNLEAELPSNKFLEINRDRVSDFINKREYEKQAETARANEKGSLHIPGICDYSVMNARPPKPMIHLQSLPEFQSSLGPRSRFGEGDGSFFDQWLNADIAKTKHLFDSNGFPVMKFQGRTLGGFKQHLLDFKDGKEPARHTTSYVQTYAERKAERMKREKEEKERESQPQQSENTTTTKIPQLPALTRANTATSVLTDSSYNQDYMQIDVPLLSNPLRLPSLEALSPTDRASYFGDNARIAFFESYRQLARMRNTIGLGDEDQEIEALLTARTQQIEQFEDKDELAALIDTAMDFDERSEGNESAHTELGDAIDENNVVTSFSRHQSRRAMIMEDGNEASMHPSPFSRQSTAKSTAGGVPLYLDEDSKPNTARSIRSGTNSPLRKRPAIPSRSNTRTGKQRSLYSRQRMDEGHATDEERKRLFDHLKGEGVEPQPAARPLSARSRFLVGCVRKGILPQASLIIRKGVTTTLSIASFGIGDELAVQLAASISSLPLLEGLNVADNNLTDVGLVPIVKSLTNCSHLQSFDLSRNKVDAETAKALLHFLSTPGCNLTHLLMANANVDDKEAAEFVKVIAGRRNFKELDLSENLLGSHEFALKAHETAGMALGSLLSDPRCTLETLKLSWNMLRFNSGIELVRALKVNTSLTYLDLSYNRLCDEGGDVLGNALHSNRTLRVLKLAHNNITSRPCCTILSGVVSCESLTEVDLSKNPIGELGARVLLSLDLKYGDRVKVDIRNCQLRVRDNSCWFDPVKPKTDYTLHLGDPYERCVCIEVLRLVSSPNADLAVECYQYKGPDDPDYRDLELAIFETKHEVDGYLSPREAEMKLEEARNQYKETANRIFRQYDTDGSGGLDRDELAIILDQIGMEGSSAMVNQLMSIYDTDGSGRVEEDEFVSFLLDVKAASMESVDLKPSDRYAYLKSDFNGKGNPTLYFPPEVGTVHIKLVTNSAKEISPQHISRRSVETMLDATKSSEDRSAIFDYALSVMRLQFSDAQSFYRVMLKEIGSAHQVLTRLIPRMSTPNDARLLITFGTNNDFEQLHQLRQALGPLYFVYIGLPNGFYRLNLAEESDQMCLKALVEISNSSAVHRKRVGLGDTSQSGNWMCFRNTVYEGKEFVMTHEWLNSRPEKGKLDFDFVNINAMNMSDIEISNFRLFRLMQSLGMVHEDKRRRIFDKLSFDREEGRAASKGSGYRPHTEMKTSTMEQASSYLHKLYTSYASSRQPMEERPISEIEQQYLHPSSAVPASTHPSTTATAPGSKWQSRTNTPRQPPTPGHGAAPAGFAQSPKNKDHREHKEEKATEKDKEKDKKTNDPGAGGSDSHGSFVKDMLESGIVDPTIVAERLLETLKFALAGRYITCVQLALLVEKFPEGFLPCGEFSTYRTELIIALYSRVLDIINFDYVLKELESTEVAILLFRLGWLNVWNPIKAEGRIVLDLSRREERQMLRILLVLNFAEPSQSWQEASYKLTRTDAAEEGWVLPASWYNEATLPSTGILSLKYFSGAGCQQDDCSPNPACRHTLMALVLAKSYSADVWSGSKANIDSVNAMLTKMGCQLYFTMEEQALHGSTSARGRAV